MKHTLIKMFASLVLLFGIMLGIVGVFSGCTTPRKAERCLDKNRPIALNYCFTRFPPKDSIHEVIRYEEGETITDTLYLYNTDTIYNEVTKEKIITRTRIVTNTKTDTAYKDKIITQTDTKAQELLQNAKEQIISKNKAINKRNTWVLGLSLSWLLLILILLVRALVIKRLNRG